MMASFASRSWPPPNPSAVSASPSSWKAPVSAIPTRSAISAAAATPQPISWANRKPSAASAPTPAPTSGNAQPAAAMAPSPATSTPTGRRGSTAGALGRLEELAAWLAPWQGRHPPRIDHPRTVVFAANHGVAARGVSAYPAAVTAQMVQNFIVGGAAVNQLCRTLDADLRVYEMNLDTPTADIVDGPAMSEAECARAIAYGMMAVEPGIDPLAGGEMGIANTTGAAALCMGLFGGDAAAWTGPCTGVIGAMLEHKREVVVAAG